MTPQQKMKAKLESAGIPYKQIDVYGRQIMITAWSRDAAEKWRMLVSRFARVRGLLESIDYNKDQSTAQSCLLPAVHKVWRVAAVIE